MLALSSTSASVTWVRPLEATLSSIRLRIKRRIRNGLRFILRSASGSQVISLVSAMYCLLRVYMENYIPVLSASSVAVRSCGLVDGRHVLVTVARLYRLVEAGCDGLGDPQAQVVGPCGVEDQGSVFAGQVGREAGREIFLDHHRAFHLGVGEPERSALDGLEEPGGVHAGRLRESHGLGQHTEQAYDPVVDHELEAAPLTGLAEPHAVFGQRRE